MKTFYFDWCPRPSGSIINRYKKGKISVHEIKSDHEISGLVTGVEFVCRNDGILLFSIDWKGQKPTSSIRRINIASTISHLIKRNNKHFHHYNKDLHINSYNKNFPTITLDPIEIDLEDGKNIDIIKIINDDKEIVKLEAASFKYRDEKYNAILLLKNGYAKLFEKERSVQNITREKRIIGTDKKLLFIPIYISAYGYFWPITSTLIVSILVVFVKFGSENEVGKRVFSFSMQFNYEEATFKEFWDVFSIAACVLVLFLWIHQIYMKRKRNARALIRAKGYLMHGYIYNEIISTIIKNDGDFAQNKRELTNYDRAIDIIEENIRIEK